MTVTQKFVYKWPNGIQPPEIDVWVRETLSKEEQDEFFEAVTRQRSYRQVVIDNGNMEIDDSTQHAKYKWKDQTSFKTGRQHDDVWQSYWKRWIDFHGGIFTIEIINEE